MFNIYQGLNIFSHFYLISGAWSWVYPIYIWSYFFCRSVKDKVKSAVAEHFAIDVSSLHLTHPTFFSRLDSKKAVTAHDEYWHMHVDKETYPEFHYTSLLYLTDHGRDFRGGEFVFVDSNDRMNRFHISIFKP